MEQDQLRRNLDLLFYYKGRLLEFVHSTVVFQK